MAAKRIRRPSKGTSWQTLNQAAEASDVLGALQRVDQQMLGTMVAAAMHSMVVVMHHPSPSRESIDRNMEVVLGLAEFLFEEWDRSGFTEKFLPLAPLALGLNDRARAQLLALEQEMLSPMAIPDEAWEQVWEDVGDKADALVESLSRRGSAFRFTQDALGAVYELAEEDRDIELDVTSGYRVVGVGARPQMATRQQDSGRQRPPWWPDPLPWPPPWEPTPTFPLPSGPIIFHFSPFSWRKFFTTAASVVIGAVNTTLAVPTAGVAVASVATAAAVGGYYGGGGK